MEKIYFFYFCVGRGFFFSVFLALFELLVGHESGAVVVRVSAFSVEPIRVFNFNLIYHFLYFQVISVLLVVLADAFVELLPIVFHFLC